MNFRAMLFGSLALTGLAVAQSNVDVSRYGVSKNAIYTQSSAGAPTLYTYGFEAFVNHQNGGTLTSGEVYANDFTYTLQSESSGLYYNNPGNAGSNLIPDAATLDSYYGNGSHGFSITGSGGNVYTSSLELMGPNGSAFPGDVPTITNGAWSNGRLVVAVSPTTSIAFNTFTEMDSGSSQEFSAITFNDAIVLTIEGVFQNNITGYEYITRNLSNSFSVDTSEMIAGNVYTATLGFLNIVDGYELGDQNNPIPDSQALAFYSTQTRFEIMAIPEPSTYALMALGLGLLAWPALRRRFAR